MPFRFKNNKFTLPYLFITMLQNKKIKISTELGDNCSYSFKTKFFLILCEFVVNIAPNGDVSYAFTKILN